MKLLTKTSLNFLSISLFIFLIGLMVFYYLLRHQVDENINSELKKKQTSLITQLKSVHGATEISQNFDEKITITPLPQNASYFVSYSDTVIYNENANRYFAYRQLKFVAEINNRKFLVKIYKSLAETDNLIVRILILITAVVMALILGLLILNRHTSQKAWRVFYSTLTKVNKYDLNSHEDFSLEESDIKEFNDLNNVILSMTERIKNDYYNLKEYTENASHELQTPLAIIISKLELLLQSENLKEKELKTLTDAVEASSKLSKMNKILLLLTKIENRQFPETKEIDLSEVIDEHLNNLEEVIQDKHLEVKREIKDRRVNMNPYLAEILLSNLVKNAIRHNIEGGEIHFIISDEQLVVSNSGKEIEGDTNKLFERFYKSSSSSKSMGLGLAIVQKICEVSGFNVHYVYKNEMHSFIINFNQKKSNL